MRRKKDNGIVSETIISEESVPNDYELNSDLDNQDNYDDYSDNDLDDNDSNYDEDVEEFSPEDEEYREDSPETDEQEQQEAKKLSIAKVAVPLVIVALLGVVGVLGYNVVQKYRANNTTPPESGLVVEEPENPDIYVSTVPTEKPTEVPTPSPTEKPKDIEEVLSELEDSEKAEEESKEDEEKKDEDSLSLEEEDVASLSLEEADTGKINESYKDIAVYLTDGLKTFHTKECSQIKDKNKVKTTAYAALEDDYEECTVCRPLSNVKLSSLSSDDLKLLESINVYKTPSNTRYHKENCSILKDTGIKITLKQAIEDGLEACPICNPPTLDNFKDTDTNKNTNTNNNSKNNNTSNTTNNKSLITITPTPKPSSSSSSSSSNKGGTTNSGITVINPSTVINVNALTLNGGNTVAVGGTLQLTYTYSPANANVTLNYSSSNTSVANVNALGVVSGVSAGTATISLSAPNGLVATKVITVTNAVTTTPTPTITPTTTPAPTTTPSANADTTLDLNNLGLTSVSQFIDPEEIDLSNMASMSDWQAFKTKVEANGGDLVVTDTSITLTVGGVTRLQMTEIDSKHWTIRVYDTLYTYLNRCVLKAMCTKISSTPDTLYTSIYKDYEEREFIGERYRSIGDASIKAEVMGGSTTYSIKDVNYEM